VLTFGGCLLTAKYGIYICYFGVVRDILKDMTGDSKIGVFTDDDDEPLLYDFFLDIHSVS